ncbi:MAG TPA: HlyD family efflux transporter periplasmic adaptor subunit [Xanthobacteraceae bacterium]|jgi:HlyD family secretion protein|nr:HlyD family efflux transporter periplasmic adaptor subunit [Xanthobacteraceae bacterium]
MLANEKNKNLSTLALPPNWRKRAGWTLVLMLIVAGFTWFARPRPVSVDMATVTKGAMDVTVDDEAKTRVRHVYTVSAPIAGKVLRISHPHGDPGISIHVGDQVKMGETVVAIMQPNAPSFLDARSREELQAMLAAADAAISLAQAEIRRMEAALEFSRSELLRAESLARTNSVPERTVEKTRLDVQTNEAALASAKAQLEVRRSERSRIVASLIDPSHATPQNGSGCCIELRAPVTGVVLKIIQDSEATVRAGAPLLEIGDPRDLEVTADLLSTEAVQLKPGAPVRLDGWGGLPIRGQVTRVDPAGFLKVSALGIEEQRVQTIIDFIEPPEAWSRLGHDYRVIVHATVWKSEDALRVPVGALFRKGDDWAVFSVKGERAQTTLVKIGHRNNRVAEILSGLSEGDQVIVHPSDRVKQGIRVAERDVQ